MDQMGIPDPPAISDVFPRDTLSSCNKPSLDMWRDVPAPKSLEHLGIPGAVKVALGYEVCRGNQRMWQKPRHLILNCSCAQGSKWRDLGLEQLLRDERSDLWPTLP